MLIADISDDEDDEIETPTNEVDTEKLLIEEEGISDSNVPLEETTMVEEIEIISLDEDDEIEVVYDKTTKLIPTNILEDEIKVEIQNNKVKDEPKSSQYTRS